MAQWRDIPGYEGIYKISDAGQIWSIDDPTRKNAKGGLLKFDKSSHGYPRVFLHKRGDGGKRFQVHRLVMLTFVGPPPEAHEVNHINGIVDDPRLENLEYVTRSQNLRHAYDVLKRIINNGSEHGMSKLTEVDIPVIRSMRAEGHSLQKIADTFRVNVPSISLIINGKTWRHVDPNYVPPKKIRGSNF